MQYDENAEKYGYEGEMTPMKCDELKAYKGDVYIPVYGSIADADVYLKKDADAAIAELKDVIHELQVDLEGDKATHYAESVDAGMRERRLKRALWLERARRAEARKNYWYARSCHEGDDFLVSIDGSPVKYIGCIKRTNYGWLLTWSEVESKCLKKAKEYK